MVSQVVKNHLTDILGAAGYRIVGHVVEVLRGETWERYGEVRRRESDPESWYLVTDFNLRCAAHLDARLKRVA